MELNLDIFKSISLSNTNSVKLMDRRESKYVLSYEDLSRVLEEVSDRYYILEIDNKRDMKYESTYFDNRKFSLYTAHDNGKLNRYKIRVRKYLETEQSFLEVKFKSNKKRTHKDRVLYNNNLEEYKDFINESTPMEYKELEEKLVTGFNRFTLVSKNLNERVTIDRSLNFTADGESFKCKNLSIIEVKYDLNCKESDITNALEKYRFRPYSFSKYWFGVALHYSEIKKNRLKEKLKYLSKNVDGFEIIKRAV